MTPPLTSRSYTIVREHDFGLLHDVYDGPPCEWSAERGATHTLDCGTGPGKGTRPARLLKTVLYVGTDEDATGGVVWDRWQVKTYLRNTHN